MGFHVGSRSDRFELIYRPKSHILVYARRSIQWPKCIFSNGALDALVIEEANQAKEDTCTTAVKYFRQSLRRLHRALESAQVPHSIVAAVEKAPAKCARSGGPRAAGARSNSSCDLRCDDLRFSDPRLTGGGGRTAPGL